MLPTGPICAYCRRDFAYHPGICPECLELRPLAYPSQARFGVMVCAGCADESSIFACTECGREDHPYGNSRCARCILKERLTLTLTDPATGQIRPELEPLLTAMMTTKRPQTTIYWLVRPPGHGPALLREMAAGRVPISHDTFRSLPMNPARNYLRDLLAAAGILEPYEPQIERITPWLEDLTATLSDVHRHTANQFARWVILRRLHDHAERGTLTRAIVQTSRHSLKQAVALLGWLDQHETRITELRQIDLDRYLDARPRHTGRSLHPFGRWLNRTGINTNIQIGRLTPSKAHVVMSDADRWTHVHTLIHDDAIRRYVRISGLFMLLFAQPVTAISRMRASQIDASNPERVFVTFDRTPVQMPEPLDQLLREQLLDKGSAVFVADGQDWLFPGAIPGGHLVTENIRSRLTALGIHCREARHAALFSLAAEVPHMILAQTLGISQTAASHWAALAARDWGDYIAARAE
ncbi:hypothetical protein ACOKGD_06795 [Microbacterium phosphatis]|uniref:hypothetical protein n=1 Tax=Microbacterium phosphatis TaxID=3140248 RepID=UPI0031404F5C